MVKKVGSPVQVIGTELCRQAGIDPNQVRGIDLHLHVNEPATLTVHMVPNGDMFLSDVARQFQIVAIEEVTNDGEV